MSLTIDASVAVKWVVDEDRHELARDVLRVNHPVSDCVYLACAIRSSMVLLTDDAAQYQKSRILGPNMRAVHLRDWTLGLPADSTG